MADAYLLDTSALLSHFRQEPGFAVVQDIFQDEEASIFISSLSVLEFARRIQMLGSSPEEARRAALEYASLADEVITVDTALSIHAFELGNTAEERLPFVDAIIAASASVNNATLVHRDAHFETLPQSLVTTRSIAS